MTSIQVIPTPKTRDPESGKMITELEEWPDWAREYFGHQDFTDEEEYEQSVLDMHIIWLHHNWLQGIEEYDGPADMTLNAGYALKKDTAVPHVRELGGLMIEADRRKYHFRLYRDETARFIGNIPQGSVDYNVDGLPDVVIDALEALDLTPK